MSIPLVVEPLSSANKAPHWRLSGSHAVSLSAGPRGDWHVRNRSGGSLGPAPGMVDDVSYLTSNGQYIIRLDCAMANIVG